MLRFILPSFGMFLLGMGCLPALMAQVMPHSCASTAFQAHLIERTPALAADALLIDQQIKSRTEAASRLRTQEDTTELTIPIAFHILHDYGPENIPDSLIFKAVRDLNEGFANQGVYDPTTGVPIHISFCLSQKGKYGEPSTGIERIRDPDFLELVNFGQDSDLKRAYAWPTDKVLNVYSVGNITFATAYSSFPQLVEGGYSDGIVIDAPFVGYSQTRSAVLIHEVGHFLGLYHTFQDNCRNFDCLLQGDRVCDTPPDARWKVMEGCIFNNNCPSDADDPSPNNPFSADGPDMNINYMDYNDFNCQTAFTEGQRARMRFAAYLLRPRLLGSDYCLPGLGHDASIYEIHSPAGRICGDSLRPRIRLLNQGNFVLRSLEIFYGIDGLAVHRYDWEGVVSGGGSYAYVDLPAIARPPAGRYTFLVRVARPNGVPDELPENDTLRSVVWSLHDGFVPLAEDFEDGLPGRWLDLSDPLHHFEIRPTGGCDAPPGGNGALTLVNDFYRTPLMNTYISPVIDLDRHEDPYLVFDHSFAQQQAPEQPQSLVVEVVPECGAGDAVVVFDTSQYEVTDAVVNDLSYVWAPVDCGDWSSARVDLRAWAGQKIALAFRTEIGKQDFERIYLDNIRVSSSYAEEKALNGIELEDIRLSPVPNDGRFVVDFPVFVAGRVDLQLSNAIGQMVWELEEAAPVGRFLREVDLLGIATGVYFLRIGVGEERFVKKMVVYY